MVLRKASTRIAFPSGSSGLRAWVAAALHQLPSAAGAVHFAVGFLDRQLNGAI